MTNSDIRMETMPRLPAATLHALLEQRDRRGAGPWMQRLRQAGYDGGEEMGVAFEHFVSDGAGGSPEELPLEEFNAHVAEFFERCGWGRLSMSSIQDLVAAVDLAGCWEAEAAGEAPGPCCHVSTGLLAAFFSRFAPYPLATLEVECASAGAHRCRFLLGQPETLSELYQLLSRGEDYGAALAQLSGVSASS